jgi:rsbT co-antagonist protein RsbR
MWAAKPASPIRLSLRHQLMLALGILASLLLALGAVSIVTMLELRAATDRALRVDGRLSQHATDVALFTQLSRRYELELFLNLDDPTQREFAHTRWRGTYANLESAIDAFRRAATDEADRRQADAWQRQSERYRNLFLAIATGAREGAIQTPYQARAALASIETELDDLSTSSMTVAQQKSVAAQRSRELVERRSGDGIRLLAALAAVATLAAMAWVLLFPARLMRPIAALQTAVARLTGGDLAARVALTRADELGVLGRGFDEMAATIQQRTGELEAQYALAQSARLEAEAARAATAEQLAMIESQRATIREMSVPLLPLSNTALVLPLVGDLDAERLRLVQERALHAIAGTVTRHLILDITGVPLVDTNVANGLIQIVQAARLLGAEVLVVGIRPEVAQTIAALGVDLSGVTTLATLQSGIAHALRHH